MRKLFRRILSPFARTEHASATGMSWTEPALNSAVKEADAAAGRIDAQGFDPYGYRYLADGSRGESSLKQEAYVNARREWTAKIPLVEH